MKSNFRKKVSCDILMIIVILAAAFIILKDFILGLF